MTDTVLNELLTGHPAFKAKGLICTPGYTIPVFKDLLRLELSKQNEAVLGTYGITAESNFGAGNYVYVEHGMAPISLKLHGSLKSGSHFIIEDGSSLKADIFLSGTDHIFCCGKSGPNRFNLNAFYRGHGCGVFIGKGGTCGSLDLWLEGENNSVHIGDDALFAGAIGMRLGDGHGMIDFGTRQLINKPASIVVGPHVWLGQETMVLKGTMIGAGCIVGARSIVTKDIQPFTAAAGVPAKTIRKNVSWTRQASPDDGEMNELLNRTYMNERKAGEEPPA